MIEFFAEMVTLSKLKVISEHLLIQDPVVHNRLGHLLRSPKLQQLHQSFFKLRNLIKGFFS